jgi:cytochrome c peroxidase
MASGCAAPTDSTVASTSAELSPQKPESLAVKLGEDLFDNDTFAGNGRTCGTCHGESEDFTVSPADAQERYHANRHDPLFRAIDSDDGSGHSYDRLLTDATILVNIPLPANVAFADDPTERTATFARAIPTIRNIALDPVLMSDGREPNLNAQAASAVNSHFQPHRQPLPLELDLIAAYERTEFSSTELETYAQGGAAPVLPPGNTPSEQRGRNWFIESPTGFCGHCHGGPMLNAMNKYNPAGLPVGTRFFTAFVSELNDAGTPTRDYVFTNADGTTTTVTSPDPGRALITGNAADANLFKITTLWGSKDTAPYFHDNSARTLEDLMAHYKQMFIVLTNGALVLSDQDQADIIAYLKLL